MANLEENVNQPSKGLHLDTFSANLDPTNSYTYAFNARQESEDGNQFNLSNEPSNTLGVAFPEGSRVIGHLNIIELGYTVYWLTNNTGSCEIGSVPNDPTNCTDNLDSVTEVDCCGDCPLVLSEPGCTSTVPCRQYTTLLSAPCLNLRTTHRIKKARYNLTNKTTEIYWTDDYNPPMWVDLQNIPLVGGSVDCNQMRIFPDFRVPTITAIEEPSAGNLTTGAYQFFVAYTNSKGNELSQYYCPTNPATVWVPEATTKFDFPTGKAIKIAIDNLDTQYKYFNIAVGKTIDNVISFEVCGTYNITSPTFTYTYTGDNKTPRLLTTDEILFKAPYYLKAGTLETQSQVLMLGDLTTDEEINYQSIASAIKLKWETWQLPYNRFEAYNKGTNTANIRGYLRDEVYAFDVVFLLANGRFTDRFHIPGRTAGPNDLISIVNGDTAASSQDPCDTPPTVPKWKIYNTGSFTGTSTSYIAGDDCYVGPYQYGEFGYWESTDTYPSDPVWGPLAGTLIRHHKFPDELITQRYSSNSANNIGAEHMVYPIGVKLDIANIKAAIEASDLTANQKSQIVGIKIVRGNRSQNKSIEARGLLFNVGTYDYQGQSYLYPNYCFNDVHPDVFISTGAVNSQGLFVSTVPPRTTDYNTIATHQLNGFTGTSNRYTFMSPDTSFSTPPLDGTLRLESIEYGKADAHIVQVQDNPRYTIGTQKGVKVAAMLAIAAIFAYDFGFDIATQVGSVSSVTTTPKLDLHLDISQFLPAFNTAYDLITKLTPSEQYGYQYNAVGNYCQSIPIANSGNKARPIDVAGYISPGMLTLPGETLPLNNFQRESSVYIRTVGALPYTHSVAGPQDNSRFTFGSYNHETGITLTDGQRVQRDIASYYATIKRIVPDQYGQIYTYQTVDTGYLQYLDFITMRSLPTVFGGDTFINRFGDKRKLPFFVTNTWGMAPDTDVMYNVLGNVGNPTYYLTTGPVDPSVGSVMSYFDDIYTMITGLPGIIGTILTGGLSLFIPVLVGIVKLVVAIVGNLGLKNVILDRHSDANYFERGVMYLFAYGLPYFFVESDVNCDYRQAGNAEDQNFFPAIGTDIPDFWLQEKTVSIAKDNYHLYNRSLSRQNLENYFDHLPADYDATKVNVFHHSTRVIRSEKTNLEELQNNWLVYRANNYDDFPLTNGTLVDLNAVEQERVIATFENNMAVYNSFITMPTDIKSAVTGTGLFSTPPQEYSKTNIGYAGTQHKTFIRTQYGHFWVDAKRGDVFQYTSSQGLKEISRLGVRNWLKENLPFKLAKYFPEVDMDNSYNGAGITMVWDNRFERLFITKRDFIPIEGKGIKWDGAKFYVGDLVTTTVTSTETIPGSTTCCPDGLTYNATLNECIGYGEIQRKADPIPCPDIVITTTTSVTTGGDEVSLYDPAYFCDASWTISYSPVTQSWVSLYSFKPNFYVEQTGYFQSGLQGQLWDHLLTNKCYQTFYNVAGPFDVETLTKPDAKDQTLMSVSYKTDVLRYTNSYDWKYMQNVTYNEAMCYSTQGTSGKLSLHMRDKANMLDGLVVVPGLASIDIPVSLVSNVWRFNKFTDIVKDANCTEPILLMTCANDMREVNPAAVDYTIVNDMSRRKRLKADFFKIRLRNSLHTRYKFIYKFIQDLVVKTTR